MILDSII